MMTNRREATVDGTVSLFMTFLFGSLYLQAATAVVGLLLIVGGLLLNRHH